jgi:hypothetical protein
MSLIGGCSASCACAKCSGFHRGQDVAFRTTTGTEFGHVAGFEGDYVMVRWVGTKVVTGVTPGRLRGLPPGHAGRVPDDLHRKGTRRA